MRVLHVIDSGGFYGAEAVLLNLMLAQQTIGLEPILLSIGTPDIDQKQLEVKALEFGLEVRPLRMTAGLNIAGSRAVFRLAAAEKADLLHSHGYKGNILLGLLPLWWRKIPLVSTLHGWTWTGKLNRMMLYEWLDALSLRFVDRVVFVNRQMRAHSRLRKLPVQKTSLIENGVDILSLETKLGNAAPKEVSDFVDKRYTVIAVGRFSPEKGLSFLIDAVVALVDCGCDLQLLLVGEGHLRASLEEQVKTLDIVDRVLMPGYVDNVPACLAACNLFVMPSLTEGLPMALLEAMAADIPVIASRVGGIPGVLENGVCGKLVTAGRSEELKDAIRSAYLNPEDFVQSATLAKNKVVREFSAEPMAERYLSVYRAAIGQRGIA